METARDELSWLGFVVPRQALQLLASRVPLSRLRDALPASVVARLRLGLYPARVERAGAPACERRHPGWGDPAELDPARPVAMPEAPRASVLIVTYGNLALVRLTLAAVQRAATTTPYEIIVVDNASPDGTLAALRGIEAGGLLPLRVVANPANRGFAAANNQAARLARAEALVFLNPDTVVTDGWLDHLVGHLDADATVGLVGPSTNACGHPDVEVPALYRDLPAMEAFAAAYTARHAGELRDVTMMPLFCAAMRHSLFTEVGGLDEDYGVGMFEDDDLAMAVRRRGGRVTVARDAFVHHYGGASFGSLSQLRYLRIFWENRRRFEKKWGERWRER